jgi:hypothetical protein
MSFAKQSVVDGSGNGISLTAPVVNGTVTNDIYENVGSCRGIISTESGTIDVILTRNGTEVATTEFLFAGINHYSIGTFVSSSVAVSNLKFFW